MHKSTLFVIISIFAHYSCAAKVQNREGYMNNSLNVDHQNEVASQKKLQIPDLQIAHQTDQTNDEKIERTLILIKPDAMQRKLVGKIIERFENTGFKLVGMKLTWATKRTAEEHYNQLKNRPFYDDLTEFMTSSPIIPMVWEGKNVIRTTRKMIGKSEPDLSLPGTIRGDFSSDRERNVIHGSHSNEAARKEIDLWFHPDEVIPWTSTDEQWTYFFPN